MFRALRTGLAAVGGDGFEDAALAVEEGLRGIGEGARNGGVGQALDQAAEAAGGGGGDEDRGGAICPIVLVHGPEKGPDTFDFPYTVGSGNRITGDGAWSYTYDDEGNMTKKSKGASLETWTYGYDHRNQLTWVEKR